jgi:hypothetical protein
MAFLDSIRSRMEAYGTSAWQSTSNSAAVSAHLSRCFETVNLPINLFVTLTNMFQICDLQQKSDNIKNLLRRQGNEQPSLC